MPTNAVTNKTRPSAPVSAMAVVTTSSISQIQPSTRINRTTRTKVFSHRWHGRGALRLASWTSTVGHPMSRVPVVSPSYVFSCHSSRDCQVPGFGAIGVNPDSGQWGPDR